MALPNPTTGWKTVKWLLRAAEFAVPAGIAWLEDELDANEAASDPHWVRVIISGARTSPGTTSEDRAQFKLDLLNITGGALDSSWTSADLNSVHSDITAFLTALQPLTANNLTFNEVRYYDMSFNPAADVLKPFAETGPPIRKTTVSYAGSVSVTQPYQIAATITFRTAWPRHWGRIYLPNPAHGSGAYTAYGRFSATYESALTTAFDTFVDALGSHDFLLTVPVGQLNKQAFHALLGVPLFAIDDIPDVQRRRRPRQRYSIVETPVT